MSLFEQLSKGLSKTAGEFPVGTTILFEDEDFWEEDIMKLTGEVIAISDNGTLDVQLSNGGKLTVTPDEFDTIIKKKAEKKQAMLNDNQKEIIIQQLNEVIGNINSDIATTYTIDDIQILKNVISVLESYGGSISASKKQADRDGGAFHYNPYQDGYFDGYNDCRDGLPSRFPNRISNKKQAADWYPDTGDIVVVVKDTIAGDGYAVKKGEIGVVEETYINRKYPSQDLKPRDHFGLEKVWVEFASGLGSKCISVDCLEVVTGTPTGYSFSSKKQAGQYNFHLAWDRVDEDKQIKEKDEYGELIIYHVYRGYAHGDYVVYTDIDYPLPNCFDPQGYSFDTEQEAIEHYRYRLNWKSNGWVH